MYHFDNGKIYNCMKCRHVGFMPGCIFHKDYVPSENNYPCDMDGNPIKSARKEDGRKMNAPDKIYTCYNIEEGEKRQLWSTVLLSDVEQVGEYIRKDALLDWLKAVKADPMIPMNIDRVIEKIESL